MNYLGYNITNLDPLTSYTVQVSAVNMHGESGLSNSVVISTIDKPEKPDPVVVSEVGNKIKFSFIEP